MRRQIIKSSQNFWQNKVIHDFEKRTSSLHRIDRTSNKNQAGLRAFRTMSFSPKPEHRTAVSAEPNPNMFGFVAALPIDRYGPCNVTSCHPNHHEWHGQLWYCDLVCIRWCHTWLPDIWLQDIWLWTIDSKTIDSRTIDSGHLTPGQLSPDAITN